ncbi:MAG: lamin tail domain-containing protein, partial [Bacteroidota bacterium]
VRVQRSATQMWTLQADYERDGNFVTEGSVVDDTYRIGQYMGWQCNYTSSRRDKFFLDDVFVAPLFVDNLPPALVSTDVLDERTIALSFDENIAASSVSDLGNYELSPLLPISTAIIDPADAARLLLTTSMPLVSEQPYELLIRNISDENGNTIQPLRTTFTYVRVATASAYDILFNEIMVDPTPALGLPEAEFIELYNRSDKNINLSNIELLIGDNALLLPDVVLAADSYAVLVDADQIDAFEEIDNAVAVDGLPALRNSGEQLSMYNAAGDLIHAIAYSTDWYQNTSKDDGGFTLELINPLAPCLSGVENWRASDNGNGGTPGRINSVIDAQPDVIAPRLLRAFPVNAERVRLFFDKKLDLADAENIDNYSVDNNEVVSAQLELPLAQTLLLELAEPLVAGTAYDIRVDAKLTDCIANPLTQSVTVTTALPATISAQDIVINELMYQPLTGGSDFIELYNRSDKVLNISDLILANRDASGALNVVRSITSDYLLFPQQYVVLTEDRSFVLQNYGENACAAVIDGANIIENDLPSYVLGEGTAVVYIPDSVRVRIIDEFDYSDDLHNPLVDDTRGVSLERVDVNEPTRRSSNWYSATATAGFATPGCPNSVALAQRTNLPDGAAIFALESETFSPDGDGFEDFLIINYKTDRTDYIATVQVYDMNGRLIKTLLDNESLSTTGFVRWDGSTDATSAQLGIYVIYAQLFDTEGGIRTYKETCVLAAPLD